MNKEIAKDALYGVNGEGWELLFELTENRQWGHGELVRYIRTTTNNEIYQLNDGGCSCGWTFENKSPTEKDWKYLQIIPKLEILNKNQTLVTTQSGLDVLGFDFITKKITDSISIPNKQVNEWIQTINVNPINKLYRDKVGEIFGESGSDLDKTLMDTILMDWTSIYNYETLILKSSYETTRDVMLAKELYNQASLELEDVIEYNDTRLKILDDYLDKVLPQH